jgi:hypothetical protein
VLVKKLQKRFSYLLEIAHLIVGDTDGKLTQMGHFTYSTILKHLLREDHVLGFGLGSGDASRNQSYESSALNKIIRNQDIFMGFD